MSMTKAELFSKTIKAAERLKKAIALAFPAYYIDKLDAELNDLWEELEQQNLMDEFADYALT